MDTPDFLLTSLHRPMPVTLAVIIFGSTKELIAISERIKGVSHFVDNIAETTREKDLHAYATIISWARGFGKVMYMVGFYYLSICTNRIKPVYRVWCGSYISTPDPKLIVQSPNRRVYNG